MENQVNQEIYLFLSRKPYLYTKYILSANLFVVYILFCMYVDIVC
jgi:hypothetical protein